MSFINFGRMISGIKILSFLKNVEIEDISYKESEFEKDYKKYEGSILDYAELELNGEKVAFLLPHQFEDGSFYIDGKESFTPLIVVEKDRLLEGKASSGRINLNNSYIVPLYWFAVALSIERIVKNEYDAFKASAMLSSLITSGYPQGVVKYNPKDSENKVRIILRKPFFFPLKNKNLFLRNAQLRMVKYLDRMVSLKKRYNSDSFKRKVGLVETPESKDIGLVRFLSYGAKYDPEKLSIIPSKHDESGYFTPSTLSVPFFNHSDSPRIMMGGKNMKQALKVDSSEKPLITTSFEPDYMGVNAIVGYMSYKGLNFEDAVVVSQSFSKKMHVSAEEKIDFFFESNKKISSLEDFMRLFKTRKKDDVLKPRQWLVRNDEDIQKVYSIDYKGKLLEISEPKLVVQNPKIRYREKQSDLFSYKITFKFLVSKPLKVGDKLMGRHGNKGVISKILPDSEMPSAKVNGKKIALDAILNPMGVISRMNISQLIETTEALLIKYGLKDKNIYKPFEKLDMKKSLESLQRLGADELGKFEVKDKNSNYGRINVGIQYIVRLYHNATEKLAARSTGPISPLSGLPLHGRKKKGGQRIGEMEVWSLLSHGALKTLNSLFKLKDDRSGVLVNEALKILGYEFSYDFASKSTIVKKISFPKDEIEFETFKRLRYKMMREERKEPFTLVIKKKKETSKPSDEDEETSTSEDTKKYYIPNSEMIEALNLKNFFLRNMSEDFFEEGIKRRVFNILSGKDGLMRSVILGKRINYSGRAVIVPAPDLTIDEVYLPLKMAYEFMHGSLSYATKMDFEKFIEGKSDGKKLSKELEQIFTFRKDFVLLNRQPSLHRHNILSFRPKVWPQDVIGLPILVCKGYNADFDGDQMAVYYPQGQKDFTDELENMMPSKNLFDTGSGELILHLTQDVLLGAYLKDHLDEKALKEYVEKMVGNNDFTRWLLEKQKGWLDFSTTSGVTLTYFEIEKNCGSYETLKKSKARGNEKQFAQLNKEIKINDEVTIHSNFVKGLSVEDYVMLTYRGINSMCDKKVNVARPGYLTRKLVETMYPLRIEDCICDGSMLKVGLKDSKADVVFEDEYKLSNALAGRYGIDNDILSKKDVSDCLKAKGYVEIFSPITSSRLCSRCYGIDLARRRIPKLGEYVGVTAATAIGERETQKAMETFHTGINEIRFSDIEKALLGESGKDKKELLQKIVDKVYNFKERKGLGLDGLKMINFELLVYSISLLSDGEKIKWKKAELMNPLKRGFLSALSFESPKKVIDKVSELLEDKDKIVFEEKSEKFFGRRL